MAILRLEIFQKFLKRIFKYTESQNDYYLVENWVKEQLAIHVESDQIKEKDKPYESNYERIHFQ